MSESFITRLTQLCSVSYFAPFAAFIARLSLCIKILSTLQGPAETLTLSIAIKGENEHSLLWILTGLIVSIIHFLVFIYCLVFQIYIYILTYTQPYTHMYVCVHFIISREFLLLFSFGTHTMSSTGWVMHKLWISLSFCHIICFINNLIDGPIFKTKLLLLYKLR